MTFLAALASLIGLFSLALAMPSHQRTVFGAELRSRSVLQFRVLGWSLLGCSLALAIETKGVGGGLVTWFATLAATGLALTLLLSLVLRAKTLPRVGNVKR